MPIENERKYLLQLDLNLYAKLSRIFGNHALQIEQVYLEDGVRVRRIKTAKGNSVFEFTYKRPFEGKNLEINTTISLIDFERFKKCAKRILKKERFHILLDIVIWDIDFFYNNKGDIALAVAEVEMPEGMDEPVSILPVLQGYIIKLLDRDDKELTSYALSDHDHLLKMAELYKHG